MPDLTITGADLDLLLGAVEVATEAACNRPEANPQHPRYGVHRKMVEDWFALHDKLLARKMQGLHPD